VTLLLGDRTERKKCSALVFMRRICDAVETLHTTIRVRCEVLNILGGGDFLIARFEFLTAVLVKIQCLHSGQLQSADKGTKLLQVVLCHLPLHTA
jgi:hypothetical protein